MPSLQHTVTRKRKSLSYNFGNISSLCPCLCYCLHQPVYVTKHYSTTDSSMVRTGSGRDRSGPCKNLLIYTKPTFSKHVETLGKHVETLGIANYFLSINLFFLLQKKNLFFLFYYYQYFSAFNSFITQSNKTMLVLQVYTP